MHMLKTILFRYKSKVKCVFFFVFATSRDKFNVRLCFMPNITFVWSQNFKWELFNALNWKYSKISSSHSSGSAYAAVSLHNHPLLWHRSLQGNDSFSDQHQYIETNCDFCVCFFYLYTRRMNSLWRWFVYSHGSYKSFHQSMAIPDRQYNLHNKSV